MYRLHHGVRLGRQEAVDLMRPRDRHRLGATVVIKRGSYPGERERRPVLVEREPDHVFLLPLGFRLWRVFCDGRVKPLSRRSPVVGFGLILDGWNGRRTDEMEIETSRSRGPRPSPSFRGEYGPLGRLRTARELEHRYRQTLFRQALFHKSLFGVGQLGIEHALIPINVSLVCA